MISKVSRRRFLRNAGTGIAAGVAKAVAKVADVGKGKLGG